MPRQTHAGATNVGKRREHNEDYYLAEPPVFAVADGVGGAAKGEVASKLAIEAFQEHAQAGIGAATSQEAAQAVEKAVLAANARVNAAQVEDPDKVGMATTLTGFIVREHEIIIGHVGDSRCYIMGGAGIRQVTDDHSLVGELERSGRISAADAAIHPQRNVITRAIGPDADISVDIIDVPAHPGDWLLACSDGLTAHLDDDAIDEVFRRHIEAGAERVVDELIYLANERGGSDNITVVLVQPVSLDPSDDFIVQPLAAEESAQMPVVEPVAQLDPAAVTGEIPIAQTQPLTSAHQKDTALPPPAIKKSGIALRIFLIGLGLLAAVVIAFYIWSQSYFVTARADGKIGIDRGIPVLGLSTNYTTSDLDVADIEDDDREQLVDSHTIRSLEDAEKIVDGLELTVIGSLKEANTNTVRGRGQL